MHCGKQRQLTRGDVYGFFSYLMETLKRVQGMSNYFRLDTIINPGVVAAVAAVAVVAVVVEVVEALHHGVEF